MAVLLAHLSGCRGPLFDSRGLDGRPLEVTQTAAFAGLLVVGIPTDVLCTPFTVWFGAGGWLAPGLFVGMIGSYLFAAPVAAVEAPVHAFGR